MEEIWKPIEGYEGQYEVSNMGRVRSLYREFMRSSGRLNKVPERLLQLGYSKKGYANAILSKDGRKTNAAVHRLVASAFIPNPDNLPCVNHKDCDPSNNCVDNLEWCTYAYNSQYAAKLGRMSHKLSERHVAILKQVASKPVYCLETATWYSSRQAAASALGVSVDYVTASIKRNGRPTSAYHDYHKYTLVDDPENCQLCIDAPELLRHRRKAYETTNRLVVSSRKEIGDIGLMPNGSLGSIDRFDGYVPSHGLFFVDIGYATSCPYSEEQLRQMLVKCQRKFVRATGRKCVVCETTGQYFPSPHYAEIALNIASGSIHEVLNNCRKGYYKKRNLQFKYVDCKDLNDAAIDQLIPYFEKLATAHSNGGKSQC